MAEMVDTCTTTTLSQTEDGWSECQFVEQTADQSLDFNATTSSMELVPYTPPPLYGPFLPEGLAAGNSIDTYQATSSIPSSFMSGDEDRAAAQATDIKSESAVRGMCGLRNMGNTCFMNSGLQCLIHHPRLALYLLDHEGALSEDGMASHFTHLLQKTWAGLYSVLHPGTFKEAMGFIHPQFKDFRQHDGQEFLALLLDTLHEELNQANLPVKSQSPATDYSEESNDYASEASTSKLSELEALDIDSGKEETPPSSSQNNRRNKMQVDEEDDDEERPVVVSSQTVMGGGGEGCEGSPPQEVGGHSPKERRGDREDGGSATKLPSIEEFYMKDVKTLNTNMLQGEEISPSVTDSSEKFPKKNKSPLPSSIHNPMDPPSDSSSTRSVGKPKKTNVLAAKKSKANLRTESNTDKSKENSEVSQDEPDPIKRMKMDLNGEQFAKIYEETNGLSPMKFHDYVTSCTMDSANNTKSVNIFSEKMINKLAELEGPADSTTGIKTQFLSQKFVEEATSNLEPQKHFQIQSSKQFEYDNEKILKGPSQSDSSGLETKVETKLDRNFVPNNQQYFAAVAKAKEDLEERMKVDSSTLGGRVGNGKALVLRRGVQEGETEWDRHVRRNQSVVVDTFQGQFKSTVVCAVCGHVSIMFEPFMYLSVPLPRAMDKQLIITVISSQGHLPVRYLVTLNRLDSVRELRQTLRNLSSQACNEEKEIIIAEVLDNHVSKFLEDGLQLRCVNDCYRLLYAFEVSAHARENLYRSLCPDQGNMLGNQGSVLDHHRNHGDILSHHSNQGDVLGHHVGNSPSNFDVLYMNEHSNMSSQSDDVITHMGDATAPSFEAVTSSLDIEVTTSAANEGYCPIDDMEQPPDITSTSGLDADYGAEAENPYQTHDVFTNVSYYDEDANECEGATAFELADSTDAPVKKSSSTQAVRGSSSGLELWADSQTGSIPWVANNEPADNVPTNSPTSVNLAWQQCAICLEDLPPHQLLTHKPCKGVLCAICMERAVKHYGDQAVNCPVCRQEIDPATDYVAMAGASSPNMMKRVLLLSLTFRNDVEDDGVIKTNLFGHPRVLYTLNEVCGEDLFMQVENLMPISAPFSLLLTDSQGLGCSRCSYELHCRGCELVREVDITLSSDDHLTVVYHNLPHEIVDSASRVCEDESVADYQGNEPITLRDCFQAFTESETLDEHNPWFCPECKEPQPASKTISVCRYPDTLIVYLKRFVFHQAMSTKLDNKVLFPSEDMDVGDYMNVTDTDEDLVYDLQSAVNHFGGVNAGHYTAYVRNPWTSQWQYCNDETVTNQEPSEQDASSVYILFYSRKGSCQDFPLPPSNACSPKLEEINGGSSSSSNNPPPPPPLIASSSSASSSSSSASSSSTTSSAPISPPETRMEESAGSPMADQREFMGDTDLDKLIEELKEDDSTTLTEGDSCSEAEGQGISTPRPVAMVCEDC